MGDHDDGSDSQRRWIVHLVTRTLRQAGATEVGYDPDQQLLSCQFPGGPPRSTNLADLFRDCLAAGADDRAVHIDRFVATASTVVPSTWDQVATQLRPVLRPGRYAGEAGQPARPLFREFQPMLNEMVVIDQPDLMLYVTAQHAADWGVAKSAPVRYRVPAWPEPPVVERLRAAATPLEEFS